MGEVGECSSAKPSEEYWATLVPVDARYSMIELTSDEVVICTVISSSSLEKRVWCKIKRNHDQCSATIQSLSSNAIIVDGVVIHDKGAVSIKSGSEIFPGPEQEGYLCYKFEVMPTGDGSTQQLKICLDVGDVKCSICLNLWHDVVTVAPCLHNFCNGCFSEWLRRSQEKHKNVLCPHCRAVVQFVGRNHFLHTIAEDILKSDASLKRSDEEIALLNSYASIQSNLLISNGKKQRRKRAPPPVEETNDYMDNSCPQCGRESGGFQCNQDTFHLQCHACGGMMPYRTDIAIPQHCIGCDRAFCGAYWHAQGVTGSHFHPLCSHEALKPIKEHAVSGIPSSVHEGNRFEQDITERCIRKMGKSVQDVISDWIVRLNNRVIDRTTMPLNHAEMITSATHVCNECFHKLVSFLLYWFRICMPKHLQPPEAAGREDCWYGYACRTQHHSLEHARKRNHVCRPTRAPRG